MQDYTHSDYPVTLPLRRPYSGDPGILLVPSGVYCNFVPSNHPLFFSYIHNAEILDEEEFRESSANKAQDGELTAAEELGLMVMYY